MHTPHARLETDASSEEKEAAKVKGRGLDTDEDQAKEKRRGWHRAPGGGNAEEGSQRQRLGSQQGSEPDSLPARGRGPESGCIMPGVIGQSQWPALRLPVPSTCQDGGHISLQLLRVSQISETRRAPKHQEPRATVPACTAVTPQPAADSHSQRWLGVSCLRPPTDSKGSQRNR